MSDNTITYSHFDEASGAEVEFDVEFSVAPGQRATYYQEGFSPYVEEVRFRLLSVKFWEDESDEFSAVVPAGELGPTIREKLTAMIDRLYDQRGTLADRIDAECVRHNEVMIGPD